MAAKASRISASGSGGRSVTDRQPHERPRGGAFVGLEHSEPVGVEVPTESAPDDSITKRADAITRIEWTVHFRNVVEAEKWNWFSLGSPPIHLLQPVRIRRASRKARHIPVTAFSVSNDDHVWLESGLEHDLLRKCDRDPAIKYLLSQPFRLTWMGPTPGRHVPDLISLGAGGQVMVWDVRRPDQQDDEFKLAAEVTRRCCDEVGWQYEVFGGLATIERLNLLWLHGFRRRPNWCAHCAPLVRVLAGAGGATLGDLFGHDDGSGELKSVVWHLVWGGQLEVDVTARIDEFSPVTVNEELWDVWWKNAFD